MSLKKRVKFKNFFRKTFLLSLLTLSVADAVDVNYPPPITGGRLAKALVDYP
jgi:hypothetical protein